MVLSVLIVLFVFENPSSHPWISKAELRFILSNQENVLNKRVKKRNIPDLFIYFIYSLILFILFILFMLSNKVASSCEKIRFTRIFHIVENEFDFVDKILYCRLTIIRKLRDETTCTFRSVTSL